MNLFFYRFALAAIFTILIGSTNSQAENKISDFYFQEAMERYYNNPSTSRLLGMGGSSSLTSIDSSAIVGNPAGLGFMQRGELSGTYGHNTISGDEFPSGQGIEQTSNSGLGLLAIPLGELPDQTPKFGNLGVGWNGNFSDWNDDSFDTHAKQTKVYGSYALAVSDELSLGYNLAWNKDKLQANDIFNYPMANGFRHTLGAMYKVAPGWIVGSTLLVGHGRHHAQFEPGPTGISKTNQFGAGFGAQYQFDATTFAANIDYSHLVTHGDVDLSIPANYVGGDEKGDVFNTRVGVEQMIDDSIALRAGYRFAGLASYDYSRPELSSLDGSAYYNAFTLGAGLLINTDWDYLPQVKVDYGVEFRAVGNDDWQHAVTISLPFNVCAES
jgi:hypothetical protein